MQVGQVGRHLLEQSFVVEGALGPTAQHSDGGGELTGQREHSRTGAAKSAGYAAERTLRAECRGDRGPLHAALVGYQFAVSTNDGHATYDAVGRHQPRAPQSIVPVAAPSHRHNHR